jgi:hypothetical protein
MTDSYSFLDAKVARPSELIHIPILLKPFGKSELRTVLPSSANTVREKPANCFRPNSLLKNSSFLVTRNHGGAW